MLIGVTFEFVVHFCVSLFNLRKMEIKQHHYELRSGSRSRLHNLIISNHKELNLVVIEHRYDVKNRSCKRFHMPEKVKNTKKFDIQLPRKNNKIHEKNVKAIKKNKERSMTGSIISNQNTKQMFNDQSENKENISNYEIEQDYKGIIPCRVLLSNCLTKDGKKKDSWDKPESVYKTYKQADEPLNVYSKTNHIYSQASHCSYEVPDVLAMSNVSKQFIRKDDSGNNFVSKISYQNQISRRTTVISKKIASQFYSDISENVSRMYALDPAGRSALNKNMQGERFVHVKSAYTYSENSSNLRQSVRKWLHGNMWLWILLLFLLSLFIFDWYLRSWYLEYLGSLISTVHGMSKNMANESLPILKVNSNETRETEEKLIDDNTLISRIMTFEKEQTYLKEYLMNITLILKDYKRRQTDFQKEYNYKITDMSNKLNISELSSIVNNELKVIKHELEKLHNLSMELTFFVNNYNNYTKTQVDTILSDYIPLKISNSSLTENMLTSCNNKDQAVSHANDSNAQVTEEHVRKIVKEILQIYDADKTGQVDYALESAGGEIISIRDTLEYNVKSRVFTFFGFPLYYQSYNNNPQTVIQNNAVQPGTCWAFQNFPGYLLIRLRSVIYVTGFTLEHVSRLIIPIGNMSSAPKIFNVWGLTDENDPEPVMFGDYEFAYSGDNLQYFSVQNTEIKEPYEYIELRIHSNNGQLDYTCLYKFRVHGRPT